MMSERGLKFYATRGTADFLAKHNVKSEIVAWPDEQTNLNANCIDLMRNKTIDFVVNIPKNLSEDELNNDYTIRRTAIDLNIPIVTNARLASAFILAFCKMDIDDVLIKSLDEYAS